jgi:hypothetical protein
MAVYYIVALLLTTAISGRHVALQNRQVAPPPPDSVKITQVSTSGSGCPHDTINVTINPDQTVVLQKLTAFQAAIGPNSGASDKSKNCAILVAITYPAGYQFMLSQSAYSGYARLDQGVAGHFFTTYFVSSNAANQVSFANFRGCGSFEKAF